MTDSNDPKIGQVWRYPYLWSHEAEAGRVESKKQRPTTVSLLTTNKDGEAVVMLVPLTTLEPDNNPPEFVGFVGLSGVFLFNFRPWLPGGQSSASNGN